MASTAIDASPFQPHQLPQLQPSLSSPPLPLPHDLMPIPPPKPLNLSAGSMFSSSISTAIDRNDGLFSSSTALMSATALLQKAAQMGAAVSSGGANSASCLHSPMLHQKVAHIFELKRLKTFNILLFKRV